VNKESVQRFDKITSRERERILRQCRLELGQVWHDPQGKHDVACLDVANRAGILKLMRRLPKATLAVHDPPYNFVMRPKLEADEYANWCGEWIETTRKVMARDGSLYIWLGADQNDHFRPLPQFMQMMADTDFVSRSFITMRNQRGYGTQNNWMSVRQELLYYTIGQPVFQVQYTEIPKILRGYYKTVGGRSTENLERSKSETIRPGNVWVDVQQVFYRMHENVPGCYAQKPLGAIERIILASSRPGDLVIDFFAHSGTTLQACERTGRRCVTIDIDPIFAEIAIRRLERFRITGKTGWQRGKVFEESGRVVSRTGEARRPSTPLRAT
jgi:site-specific DNA-methyltransferase (adenine-specific)